MTATKKMDDIGLELLKHARETAEFSKQRGVVGELFPYIYGASQRMSTRAISRWLEESKNIKLSAATIAKALREQEKHWEALYEDIEPAARLVANEHHKTIWELLSDIEGFEHAYAMDDRIRSPGNQVEADYAFAMERLSCEWFSVIDESALKVCREFIADSPDEFGEVG